LGFSKVPVLLCHPVCRISNVICISAKSNSDVSKL